ncbi:SepL/TyeA/HrpJ family type III secretion system gatekeeper [Pandoraea terrae]|uniref:SepL/TyeA/HrpJ family type III secretion system gatekeeper n=1 Tax=Pandoraea terrae TaxID=1537710 RepID=A0A5E4TDX9_9BURK|nr:type III secretion system gatekeeper subunit SctW [Pandoraea terrae]VVD84604.1 SepL/TyeA/HrpJ family type III secretion system gatekeeper [Pandoraea terrae]
MAGLDRIDAGVASRPRIDARESPRNVKAGRLRRESTVADDDATGPALRGVKLVNTGPVAQMRRAAEMVDEMSAGMTQFRVRRQYGDERTRMEESYERILEEEAPAHIEKIQSAPYATLDHLRRMLRERFPDVSDRFLAIRALLQQCGGGDPERHAILQTLRDEVAAEAPPKALYGGMNCALKARLFGSAMEVTPSLLRAAYRSFLMSQSADIEVYASWIATFGHQRRIDVLHFMERALVDDCRAIVPSCSAAEFGNLLGRLCQVRRLRSGEAAFIGQVMASRCAMSFNDREKDWIYFYVGILSRPASLDSLLAEISAERAMQRGYDDHGQLIEMLRCACGSLPDDIFADPAIKLALLHQFEHLAQTAYRLERWERPFAIDEAARFAPPISALAQQRAQ